VPEPLSLLTTAYRDLSAVLSSLRHEEGREPTGCAGWTPSAVGFHLLSDGGDVTAARRGTGREPLTADDRVELGDAAGAFPLFG